MVKNQITIETINYRTCYVKNEKALFHRWIDIENSAVKETYGIIEYENGTVEQVIPSVIKFADNLINEYEFRRSDNNECY